MSDYENSKKVRRIASVIYLAIMAIIMMGTYLSQQQKEAAQKASYDLKTFDETSSPHVHGTNLTGLATACIASFIGQD